MFRRKKDWEYTKLSDEELASLSVIELQQLIDRRWSRGLKELEQRAIEELSRRNPRKDWQCLRCNKRKYHEKEIRVSGSFITSFLGWEQNKYHVLVCNYCGKSEFYNVQMSGSEKIMGFLGN